MKWAALLLLSFMGFAVLQLAVPVLLIAAGLMLLLIILRAPTEALSLIFLFVLVGVVRAYPLAGFVLLAFLVLGILSQR